MNVHAQHRPPLSVELLDVADGLNNVNNLLEAIHMMAESLEPEECNALQRVVVLGHGMVKNLEKLIQPSSPAA